MSAARPLVALGVCAALAVSTGVGAASGGSAPSAPVVLTDTVGDGNALNNQGVGPKHVEVATAPASYGALDFTRITLRSMGAGRACKGFTVAMEFAAPVDPSVPAIYRLQGQADGNTIFQIYLDNAVGHGSSAVVRHGAEGDDVTTPLRTRARISGNTILFTVTPADLKVFRARGGTLIANLSADTRLTVGTPMPVTGPAPADDLPTQAFLLEVDGVRPLERSFTICG